MRMRQMMLSASMMGLKEGSVRKMEEMALECCITLMVALFRERKLSLA